jgi:L-methionine (R)-S-oxide reductase
MAEELILPTGTKQERYEALLPQIKALISNEPNRIANMANVCAALKQGLHFFWVGFYLVDQHELVLGPFQGPVACTRIAKGKGVCGTAWQNEKTILVPDVEQFPGHIACSAQSKSEIVVPLLNAQNNCYGVLDVDSDRLNDFDETDRFYLEKICTLLGA